jgi:hypothetical protein
MSQSTEPTTTQPTTPDAATAAGAAVTPPARRFSTGRLWTALGERLNPILVKETRQALKSRQFIVTFSLLLLAAWVCTIVGVALIGQPLWYGANGREMFFVYYMVLAFALVIIVPFGALRSLASEHEEHTYELLSITTLGPRQIVSGKLGSSIVQMIIYLSAISPCLAFTYMLRGIDFPTILFIVVCTVLGSLGFAVSGLLIGTLSTAKHWQVVLSVAAVVGLFIMFYAACAIAGSFLSFSEVPFTEPQFWPVCAAFLTAYLSYFALVFCAAAARLSFSSNNRSTRLRVIMLLQQLLLVAWFTWFTVKAEGNANEDVVAGFLGFLGIHWFVMGALMTGESPDLSPRVKRRLPQSFLGRQFFTWFNPGPGCGYLFALANYAGAILLALVVAMAMSGGWGNWLPGRSTLANNYRGTVGTFRALSPNTLEVLPIFALLGLAYLTAYLGIGLLLLRLLRKVTHVGVLLAALIHFLLILLGVFAPMVIQQLRNEWYGGTYTYLQITDPFWTMSHLSEGSTTMDERVLLLLLVGTAAAVVFLLNLPAVAREVQQVRVERPRRVAEEDAVVAAIKSPPKPVRSSPWD